jgi:hypothetical protein
LDLFWCFLESWLAAPWFSSELKVQGKLESTLQGRDSIWVASLLGLVLVWCFLESCFAAPWFSSELKIQGKLESTLQGRDSIWVAPLFCILFKHCVDYEMFGHRVFVRSLLHRLWVK